MTAPLYEAAVIRTAAQIELIDVETGEVDVWRGHNAFTDAGLDVILNRLAGLGSVAALGYQVVGSGTGAFPGTETSMYHENFRKAITSASVVDQSLVYKTYFTTSQASGSIRELGFANAAASGAGTLITHLVVTPSKLKTSAQEMVVTITHEVSRA